MEEIDFMPDVIAYTRLFLGPRPAPSEAEVREALGLMIRRSRELALVSGGPTVRWKPPPLLSRSGYLSVRQVQHEVTVFATGPTGPTGPTGADAFVGITVGLDVSVEGHTRVTCVMILEGGHTDRLDPITYVSDFRAAEVLTVVWGFTRGSSYYELRVRRTGHEADHWTAALAGVYHAGEVFEIPAGSPLLINAVWDDRRFPRHEWTDAEHIVLFEDGTATLHRSPDRWPTASAALEGLVGLLSLSDALATLRAKPDSRLA